MWLLESSPGNTEPSPASVEAPSPRFPKPATSNPPRTPGTKRRSMSDESSPLPSPSPSGSHNPPSQQQRGQKRPLVVLVAPTSPTIARSSAAMMTTSDDPDDDFFNANGLEGPMNLDPRRGVGISSSNHDNDDLDDDMYSEAIPDVLLSPALLLSGEHEGGTPPGHQGEQEPQEDSHGRHFLGDGAPPPKASNSSSTWFTPESTRLRLQAIFYPKFDNENSEQRLRHEMVQSCAASTDSAASHSPRPSCYYLEASVKHSGSLILWSGSDAYYSKNSLMNPFSLAGHVLLRQHYLRMAAATLRAEDASVADHPSLSIESLVERAQSLYEACSDFVVQNRLTLSFEVMTSGSNVFGDHGQRPAHEYLILTSIANRNTEAFYSTSQLLDVAHQFHLPHNDYFLFVGKEAASALFDWYDRAKSIGTASTVLPVLEEMATVHVPSMYPHATYQGEIMEGLVVRCVPFEAEAQAAVTSPNENAESRWQQTWHVRQERSRHMQRMVQATPTLRTIVQQATHGALPRVYAASLQEMVRRATQNAASDPMATQEAITRELCDVLALPRATTARVPKSKVSELNLSELWPALSQRADDMETSRIATLLTTLCSNDGLRSGVELALFSTSQTGDSDGKGSIDGTAPTRYQLVVHVLHDWIHPKYEKLRLPGSMKLFRGFVIELLRQSYEDVTPPFHRQSSLSTATTAMSLNEGDLNRNSALQPTGDVPPLMLKLKLLPYMVRTFGIRNGLRILKSKGPAAYVKYTGDLLRKWNMPAAAFETWQPYFKAWTLYVQRSRTEIVESSYLDHLEDFDQLYKSGSFTASVAAADASTDSCLRGVLVVVAVDEQSAHAVASALSLHLKGGAHPLDLAHVTPDQLWGSRDRGCVIIATAQITHHLGAMRKLINGPGQGNNTSFDPSRTVSIVFVGCTPQDVERLESIDDKEKKKLTGMLAAWKKVECGNSIEFPASLLLDDGKIDHKSDAFRDIVEAAKKASDSLNPSDTRQGILVFCPGIPGCGKSSLIVDETREAIRASLGRLDAENPRRLLVLAGDEVKEKYWPLVVRERLQDASGVLFADKNAPLSSWDTVAESSAKSKSVAVAVTFPSVLQTTTISGTRDAEGQVTGEQNHCYPFSLDFLAICLLRVLDRKAGQHEGKLDSGTDRACLIVVKFFGLYRGLLAEDFEHRLSSSFEHADALLLRPSIPVPFLKSERPGLPYELHVLLIEAVQANYGCEVARLDASKAPSVYLDALEGRLRERIERHRTLLLSLSVDEATSRKALTSKLIEAVAEVDNTSVMEMSGEPFRPFVSLAAIDVTYNAVHELLLSTANDARFHFFWETVGRTGSAEAVLGKPSGQWIERPHVTLAHFSHTDQRTLHSTFGPLEGARVKVWPTAILWNRRVAALAVEVDGASIPSNEGVGDSPTTPSAAPPSAQSIPPSLNAFVHVTIWCSDDASSVESNDLPALVEAKLAERVDLEARHDIVGVIRLWVR